MNNSQTIINLENKKVRKQNKCTTKKKTRLNNLCAIIQIPTTGFVAYLLFYFIFSFSLTSYLRSFILLLSSFMPILLFNLLPVLLFCSIFILLFSFMSALLFGSLLVFLFCLVSTFLSCFILAMLFYFVFILLFCMMSALIFFVYTSNTKLPFLIFVSCLKTLNTLLFYPRTPIALSSYYLFAFNAEFFAILLLFSLFYSTLTYLISVLLRTLKQILLEKILCCCLTSFAEFLFLFLTFSLLFKRRNCKQTFNIIFLKSYPIACNFITNKINLSFVQYGCLAIVWFQQLWQLKLLNYKPVCIIKPIFLIVILFYDLLFAS